MRPAAGAAKPWVDVTVRYRGTIVGTRRLGGQRSDARTPLRIGGLAIGLGLTLAVLDLLTAYGTLVTGLQPLVLGGGLVAVGLVGLAVGLHRRSEPDPEAFWVGPAPGVDLPLERPGMPDRMAIVLLVGESIDVRLPPGFAVRHEGAPVHLDASAHLARRGSVALHDHDMAIEVRRSAPVAAASRWGQLDAWLVGALLIAGAGIGGAILVAHHVMPNPLSLVVPMEHTAHGIPGDP